MNTAVATKSSKATTATKAPIHGAGFIVALTGLGGTPMTAEEAQWEWDDLNKAERAQAEASFRAIFNEDGSPKDLPYDPTDEEKEVVSFMGALQTARGGSKMDDKYNLAALRARGASGPASVRAAHEASRRSSCMERSLRHA